MTTEWELEQARKDAKKLEAAGYEFKYDRYGYFVSLKGKGLGGGRVAGFPKMSPKNAQANVRDNFMSCVRDAIGHAKKNGIEWE